MKLWRISQDVNNGYDTYDSAVVAAETEDAARRIHPWEEQGEWWKVTGRWCELWAPNLKDVKVEYLGTAKRGTARGIVCASFNAG